MFFRRLSPVVRRSSSSVVRRPLIHKNKGNSLGHRPIGVLDPLTCIIYRYFILLILYIPVFIYRYFKYRFLSTDNTRAGPALGALTPKSGTTARYPETLWQPLNAHGSIFIDFSSPKSDVEKSTIFRIFKNRRKW